jgi:hypothetical protein
MICLAQAVFELQIVFNDAVMHYNDASCAIPVWVRILFGGSSVCGPTRVADPVCAIEWTEANRFLEVSKLALGATYFQIMAFIHDGDAGGIVTAILKFTQSVDN